MDPLSQLIWRFMFYMAVAVLLATGAMKAAHAQWTVPPGTASSSYAASGGTTYSATVTHPTSWVATPTTYVCYSGSSHNFASTGSSPIAACGATQSASGAGGSVSACFYPSAGTYSTGANNINEHGSCTDSPNLNEGWDAGSVPAGAGINCTPPGGGTLVSYTVGSGTPPSITCNGTSTVYTCNAGDTLSGTTCTTPYTCPSGGTLSGTTCNVAAACPTGALGNGITSVASPQLAICVQTSIAGYCGANGTPIGPQYTIAGNSFESVSYMFTGAGCTPTSSPSNQPLSTPPPPGADPTPAPGATQPISNPEVQCIDSGGSWGTFNGSSTCLPAGSSPSTQPQINTGTPQSNTTTTPGSGGTTSTTTTTTTPTTTCDPNGNCTVTDTTTNYTVSCPSGTAPPSKATPGTVPSGCTGSAGATTTGNGGTCPTGQSCGGGGPNDSWGGSCTAGFACEGDAIQCAIAQVEWQDHCQAFAASNQLGTDVDAQNYLGGLSGDQTAAAASSPVRTAIKAGQVKVDASTVTFDNTSFYGGGSCPSPSISFGSFTAVVPGMALVCTNIGYIGTVLVGLTALLCFLIYSRILGG